MIVALLLAFKINVTTYCPHHMHENPLLEENSTVLSLIYSNDGLFLIHLSLATLLQN